MMKLFIWKMEMLKNKVIFKNLLIHRLVFSEYLHLKE